VCDLQARLVGSHTLAGEHSSALLLSCLLALLSLPAACAASAYDLVASSDPLLLQLCINGCNQGSDGSICVGSIDPTPPFSTAVCIATEITYLDKPYAAMRAFMLNSGPNQGDYVIAFFIAGHNECTNISAALATTLSPSPPTTCETAGFMLGQTTVTDFIVGTPASSSSSSSSTGAAEDPSGGDHHALIIGLAVGGGVAALVAVGVAVWCCKRRSAASEQPLNAGYGTLPH
jgi:hypothetical protein